MLLKVYNKLNILARKIVSPFCNGERLLPLLHCNFEKILNKNFKSGKPFYFVQIGAFDGISHDFLFEFVKQRRSEGIVVEPLSDYFQKLVENYSFNKKIIPINVAIHSALNEIILYRIDPKFINQLPDWVAGISSIDPLHHLRTNIPSEMIVKQNVPAMSLMNVINLYYNAKKINLLQIDTEGYDYEILRSFDFDKFTPDIIKIEYVNLTYENIKSCISLLKNQGYYCLYDTCDLFGLQLTTMRL